MAVVQVCPSTTCMHGSNYPWEEETSAEKKGHAKEGRTKTDQRGSRRSKRLSEQATANKETTTIMQGYSTLNNHLLFTLYAFIRSSIRIQ